GNSGIARTTPGSDFIISLTSCCSLTPTDNQQTGTFMHELGHNLGLQHGGGDPKVYKPNYVSVMNYMFQATGVPIDGVDGTFDYSRFSASLNEQQLSDKNGITSDASLAHFGSAHLCSS